MFNPQATGTQTQTTIMKASSQTTASCFDDRFDAPIVRKNAVNDSSNNNNNSGDSICNKYSCSEKENHKASNISTDRWGADALSKGDVNRVTSKSREGIHGVRMEGQKINNSNKYGKERHKTKDFTTGAATIGPQAPSANTTSSTPNWMKDFFDCCQRDSVKLAQDLVESCINDETRKTWLELTAHRILQELLLVKATETEAANTATTTTNNNNNTNNTESISEAKEENGTNFSSPYQLKFNGEVGESAFVIFDKLMNAEAMATTKNERDKLFGTKTGDRMVRVIEQIHNSGVLFSPQWKSKYILPDNILLLCLDRRKLARAEQKSLRRIMQEFDLWKLLPLILDDWGLHTEEWFQDLFCRVKEDGWQSQTKTDMHCLIFVCRTYRCMQSLQWTNIRNSLARKVRRCLEILQDHSQKAVGKEAAPRGLNPRNTAGNASASSRKSPSHDHISQISDKDDTISVDAAPTTSTSLCHSRQEHEFDDSVPSTSHDSDGNSDTTKGKVGNKNLLVATLPSPNDKDGGSQNISVSLRLENATFRKGDNGDKEETIEQKCASFTLNEVMRLPAEKLCPITGKVLETFDTAEKARRSFSNSDTDRYYFKYSILGINFGIPPHMYNGYFWRLKGSHKTPSLVSQKIKSSRGRKRGSSIKNAATPLSSDATIEEKSLKYSASTIEEMPVEKLCLRRGLVLETFDTVALARRSVTDTIKLQRFRYMLQARKISGSIPHVFKGYFWRFQGSDRTPSCGGTSSSALSPSPTGADDAEEEMVAGGNGGGETHYQEVPGDAEGPSKKQKLGHDVDFGGESQPQHVDWAII